MAELTEVIRALYEREMTAASSTGERRCDGRTSNAHVVSQPYPWLHTGNHVAMFRRALRQHDRREVLGRVVRTIVADPGSALGWYPEGNTGRISAGLMTPMPAPGDLTAEIAAAAA
ncbi:hypothetical protein Rhow_001136 [Rhodococcus wratislaviensis]|uniref:DUF3703 domain-containing protein n=1 Tax=Rhodococcus wratislaviensis TaxID=44752 RepID=A0A402C397_RHOWR|nr:DUF3703 domain-containing protein [Rhodococcus wratislaviensis]GCE38114.1 hypothetical protein Rhow_001136 [Rhodococcus wratislaviensis]